MGCFNSKEIYELEEFNYNGEVKIKDNNIIMEGQGKQENEDGSFYVGAFKNNMYNGFGMLRYYVDDESHAVQPTVYEGYWKNNNRKGKGKLNFNDGSYYIGNFDFDNMHGKGVYYYSNGDMYKGEFLNGMIEGYGEHYDNNDCIIYEGNFLDGVYNGYGKLYYLNELIYEGQFLNGQFNNNDNNNINYRERSNAFYEDVTASEITSQYYIPTVEAEVVSEDTYESENPENPELPPSYPN